MQKTMGSLVNLYVGTKTTKVFMLKAALTEAGFWLGQPPPVELERNDRHLLSEKLEHALLSPTETLPTPARNSFPSPSSLGLPFKQGWRAFESRYQLVTVGLTRDGTYTVNEYLPDGRVDEIQSKTYSGSDAFNAMLADVFHLIDSTAFSQ